MNVLLVDDDPVIRFIVSRVLHRGGVASVRQAASGSEALEAVRESRPDCVLMDVMMPEMGGLETLAQMRTIDGMASVPVVFLTGIDDPKEKQRLVDAGGNGCMTKPFDPETFVDELRVVLRHVPEQEIEQCGS